MSPLINPITSEDGPPVAIEDFFGIRFIITAACFDFLSSDSDSLRFLFDGDDDVRSAVSSELRFDDRALSLLLLLPWCDEEDREEELLLFDLELDFGDDDDFLGNDDDDDFLLSFDDDELLLAPSAKVDPAGATFPACLDDEPCWRIINKNKLMTIRITLKGLKCKY